MYFKGQGVPQDFLEAAKWAQKAADQAYPRAETDLGFLYEQGKGVPLDYVAAHRWYELASRGGDSRATARMKSLSRVMTRQQIAAAQTECNGVMGQRAETVDDAFPGW
jgi:TPR repeat protein